MHHQISEDPQYAHVLLTSLAFCSQGV